MPPERRHVLIFEPDARGHAEEWFGHILSFVREAKPPVRVTFAVPRDLVDLLAPAAAALDDPPVAFLPLDAPVPGAAAAAGARGTGALAPDARLPRRDRRR